MVIVMVGLRSVRLMCLIGLVCCLRAYFIHCFSKGVSEVQIAYRVSQELIVK